MEEALDRIGIKSPEIRDTIRTIKNIQARLKDEDVKHLSYIETYDKLSYEFNDFFENQNHTRIFITVIKGEDLSTLVSSLYYKDKVINGELTEQYVSDKLAEKFFPKELKEESDKRINELNKKG